MSGQRLSRLRRRDEAGYAALLVALLATTILMPLTALSVDVARMYVELERVQSAADAAATAGVTYLPDDFASARATAIAVAGRNGFPNSGSSTVTVTLGSKPTQLKVTVASTIPNAFGRAFNSDWATVKRSAVADYNGPAPMGSPCNSFGNEPPAGSAEPLGSGSQIVAPPGGAACTSLPQLWGAVAGPETPKANGDARMTRKCASGTDACTGTTNTEFDPLGYFYIVRVGAAAVNTPVTMQIYDPAFVESGDVCDVGPYEQTSPDAVYPAGSRRRNDMNTYERATGTQRYASSPNTYCAGDVLTAEGNEAPVTSFALRSPTDTYRPVNGTPVTGCVKQYKGYRSDETPDDDRDGKDGSDSGSAISLAEAGTDPLFITTSRLRQTLDSGVANPLYNAEVAQVFHQWVNFCTFTPTSAGDYYLQVRTNVKLATSPLPDGYGGYKNNSNVYTQLGDDNTVKGNGNNRFALRVTGAQRGSVSIAGWDHMSIYANYPGGTSTFNLVRVIPAAASKSLLISFFDVGDATSAGTITVLPPLDSNMTAPLAGCTGGGVRNGALSGCALTNVSSGSGWNGKNQTIRVPIPNTYTCNNTQGGGCWFRLQVSFPSGQSDTTTWSARVDGDPVRLIE